ncbi:MAG: hypothetical protein Q9Q13_06560 [Acidobacteriota bacterium]|nr:hypothetical protein [Acidobacteriota bacterium]
MATCTSQSSMALRLTGRNIEIRDLELISPCYVAIGLSGSDGVLLENLNVYGGTVWAYNNSSNFTYRRLKVRNALRRPNNTGTVTGTSWDTGSQCMATQGSNFTMEDVETYGCREGFSLLRRGQQRHHRRALRPRLVQPRHQDPGSDHPRHPDPRRSGLQQPGSAVHRMSLQHHRRELHLSLYRPRWRRGDSGQPGGLCGGSPEQPGLLQQHHLLDDLAQLRW